MNPVLVVDTSVLVDHLRGVEKATEVLTDGDYCLAATTVVLAADLATTNVKHFPMFAGLTAPY